MQFFKRYNYLILVTFTLVLSVACGLFYLQYSAHYQHEMTELKSAFEERLQSLENAMQVAKNHVENMKIKAETYLITHPTLTQHSSLFSQLQPVSGPTYGLDVVTPPFTEKIVGNLTGLGSLQNREADFYRDIEMALELNPMFQMAMHNIPNAVWVYYFSANGFMNLYPWVNQPETRFNEGFFEYELYSSGIPKNNPQQQTYWTNAYIDAGGKGLMVTCATPIYDGKQFRGIVAIDFTVDVLNQFIQEFRHNIGNLLIINQNNQLLAHTMLVNSKNTEVLLAEMAFPEAIRHQWQSLFQSPEAEIVNLGDYLVTSKNLQNVPWKLIFLAPKRLFIQAVVYKIGWGFLILLPSLLIMLLITNHFTRQEFIRPAQYLVEHIKNENQGVSSPIPKKIPTNWQVWFNTVSEIFAQNRLLFLELEQYLASLEDKVKARTQDLALKNETLVQLNQEIAEINKRLLDSIEYAKVIQSSLLPDFRQVQTFLPHSFFIWQPRDIVGGDMLYVEAFDQDWLVVVMDCTGHGVPGAFMTMVAATHLQRITRDEGCHQPADILKRLNVLMKTSLQQDTEQARSDDGLDAAICLVKRQEHQLIFAGAKLPLYYLHQDQLKMIKGDKQNLGYKRSDVNFTFTTHTLPLENGMTFYLATDGLIDQLGGPKRLPLGNKRFQALLWENRQESLEVQAQKLLVAFQEYQGENNRQDDVTVVGFGV